MAIVLLMANFRKSAGASSTWPEWKYHNVYIRVGRFDLNWNRTDGLIFSRC